MHEEGLASLNALYERVNKFKDPPYLFSAALNYYAGYLANTMGF